MKPVSNKEVMLLVALIRKLIDENQLESQGLSSRITFELPLA